MLLPLLLLLLLLLYDAVCTYYIIIEGRFVPSHKYMIKYIQQKQQRQQHKNLLWQFIQISIHQLVDA